jgi:aminoglycoside phosphotransferase family enzyme
VKAPDLEQAYPALIRDLLTPAAYPHEVQGIQVVETHISWVILTGAFAYKVKKPVSLGFLDFSTLEDRLRYCEEELRVNRRTAADLYLAVVPIGRGPNGARVGLEPAVEYAVQMRQFPHAARLDRCLQKGGLDATGMQSLAATIARFHGGLRAREDIDAVFEVERAVKPARNNFTYLDPSAFDDESQQRLAVIESWTLQQASDMAPLFEARARQGAIRECHGDLHLENLLLQNGRYVPFDALEFNPKTAGWRKRGTTAACLSCGFTLFTAPWCGPW